MSQEKDRKRLINEDGCVDCGACQLACPKKCILQN
ncbi:4Fe-4S binding protein [Clostridium sardiniense]